VRVFRSAREPPDKLIVPVYSRVMPRSSSPSGAGSARSLAQAAFTDPRLLGSLVLASSLAACGRDTIIIPVDTDTPTSTFEFEEDTLDTETDTETSVCGNGLVEPGEDCDDGDGNQQNECLADCTFASCGDGFLWLGFEECDPGADAIGPNEACVPGCLVNVCGDGFDGPAEQCDDGNGQTGDGCNNDCTTGTCGNGIVDPGEQCDDDNGDNGDACLDTCVLNVCGDGFQRDGVEECDQGALNSNSGDCTLACTVNFCGDGFQHATDEECDPGAAQIGPGMACLTGCVLNGCGDMDIGPGEQCDDGNGDNGDACLDTCVLATCGDGFVEALVEECDDANANNDDACHDDCTRTEVAQVALGGNHTCARLDHGKLSCWGNGDDGRTGYASEENIGDDEPAGSFGFVDIGGPVINVITGISHTCTLFAGGEVRCFGRPFNGQLGYGNVDIIGDDELPSSVGFLDFGEPVTQIFANGGAFHSCGLLQSGGLVCWGREADGRLGYALGPAQQDVGDNETPAQWLALHGPVQVGGTVTQVVTGFAHTCALLDDGTVRCWGESNNGQLGYGNNIRIGDDETPASAGPVPVGGTVTQLAAGFTHTCAILTTGQIKCWGKGNEGRLGYGNVAWVGLVNTPASVGFVDVGGTPISIAAGSAHTCALLDDATVRCWGWGARGQLGYGNATNIGDNETPASAGPVSVGGNVVAIGADGHHTCVILDDGMIRCWGDAGDGRLGYGNLNFIGDDEVPASVGTVPVF
jgi:cysteine-rich repeat protein